MAFKDTDHGRKAIALVEGVAAHLCESYGIPRSAENRLRPIPSVPSEGFVPYTKGGVTVDVDIPLSTFVSDGVMTRASQSLPESVRAAIEAHAASTRRHHLEVACQQDPDADAIVSGWDWSGGTPVNALDEAGLGGIVSEAESEADVSLDAETLRITAQAMDRHELRDALLSIVVKANTEFERHWSDAELRRNSGPLDPDAPSVDHVIVDIDFSATADFSDAKFATLLDVVRQSLPEPEAASYGMAP